MTQKLQQTREKIARFGALLFDRHLTDIAGGNISARVDDKICITRRFSGSKQQWQISPEDVLVCDMDRNVLEGNGELSRESKVHFRLHKEFGEHGTGVIHAHSKHILVFAVMGCSLPPVLEANLKFGEVPVSKFSPAHTDGLAENVAALMRGQEARIRKQAGAVIAQWHGLFVMGKDLDAAIDAVERLDTNAYIILAAGALGGENLLAAQTKALQEAAVAAGKE